MQSGTSCFNWPVFKKTVCRFWPLWALYSVIWLIILPLNGLMTLQLDSTSNWWGGMGSYMENFAWETVPDTAGAALFFSAAFGALCAMAVLSHLYNPRSANFFGSLPVSREGLFLTHYLTGLAFLLVPNAVIFLLTLLIELAGGAVCIQGLLFWLAVSCGECLFFYSMAVFCGLFTGHILALPAFYGIFNALAAAVMGLSYITLNVFYYGYAGPENWVEAVMRWLTPVWNLAYSVHSYSWGSLSSADGRGLEAEGLGVVGIYALLGLALAAGSFFLYRFRRLESAGDMVSVRPMRPVFRYGVAVMAGLCFGFVTCFFLGGGEITLMVSIVIWGVAGCFAAQMLLDKSFKVFHKWKGAAAVAGAFVLLFLVVKLDLTGFETRIPAGADVASIEMSGLQWGWYNDSGDYLELDTDDPGTIGLLMDLHQAAIAQRDQDDSNFHSGSHSTYFTLTYHLAGDGTMSRRYSMTIDPAQVNTRGSAAWAVQRIFDNRDLYWRVYGFDRLESTLAAGGRLSSARYYYHDYAEEYEDYSIEDPALYYYGAEARTLLDAVTEDFQAGRIGVRSVSRNPSDGGWEQNRYERNLTFEVEAGFGLNQTQTVRIFVPDSAVSTLAALETLEGYAGGSIG